MNRLNAAGVLMGALVLTVLPGVAAADEPEPPMGCASSTGYSKDGSYSGRLTICFTKKKARASGGYEWMSPAVSVDAHCWHKTVLWSEQGSCKWQGTLSMKKDGVEQWREPGWSKITESTHSGDTEQYDLYRCRGYGTYTLTLDQIKMWSDYDRHADRGHPVELKPVSFTAKGC
ncbi:hypothetical protein [Streptomyces sp. NPDC057910]|uniref:hypothetical protein n=1 Tax=Streptomyces sp. NPDC057910 TaxID=3346278 RepID=UPI0036EE68A6